MASFKRRWRESGMGLLACGWRREELSAEERFSCAHPRVYAARGSVTAPICAACRHRDPEDGLPSPSRIEKDDGVPGPSGNVNTSSRPFSFPQLLDGEARSLSWSVGVTTAPRSRPTLERSLDSLAAAGWSEPRLFAEPHARVPEKFSGLATTWRDAKLGAFPNWYLGLAELYFREPSAEAYLMCQDDALFADGSRAYLEKCLWPAEELGVVSIYTPSHASAGRTPGFHDERRGWATWGALAYVFPNNSLRALLAHPLFTHHRRQGPGRGLRNIDSVVGAWCRAADLPYYIHVPSLVQHIGETSTIWTSAGALGRRRASDFVARISG
ncbi:MAG: hypothetical protein ACREHD_03940 [Pirellulales bacterium]